jgi:hypothetical protein
METNNHTIKYKKHNVKILQYLSESNTQFNERLEYIKKLEKEDIDWKEATRLSRIWYCIKYKKCKYEPEVYHKVTKYDKNGKA